MAAERTPPQKRCLELAREYEREYSGNAGQLVASYLRYAVLPAFDAESVSDHNRTLLRKGTLGSDEEKYLPTEEPLRRVMDSYQSLAYLNILLWQTKSLFCEASTEMFKGLGSAIYRYLFAPLNCRTLNPVRERVQDPLDRYLRSPALAELHMDIGQKMCTRDILNRTWSTAEPVDLSKLEGDLGGMGLSNRRKVDIGMDNIHREVTTYEYALAATLVLAKVRLKTEICRASKDVTPENKRALLEYITLPIYLGDKLFARGLPTPAHAAYFALLVLNGKCRTDDLAT